MSQNLRITHVRITDILAVDTLAPVEIFRCTCRRNLHGKSGWYCSNGQNCASSNAKDRRAVGDRTFTSRAVVAGVEAVMASLGAMTTPGTKLPLAILDMGGGSTDAAVLEPDGRVRTTHQAGAGELVTMLIQTELGLKSRTTAEQIKKYPIGQGGKPFPFAAGKWSHAVLRRNPLIQDIMDT